MIEFQPVVLAAGRGSRMSDLTSKIHKALLPIGNMPMMWYPINTLERAGFEEAIVIVLESFCTEAQKLLIDICEVKMRLDFVSIPDQDYLGTADSLRYIKDKVKKDLLIMSCDLIMDVSLHSIADLYRTYDATVTMLLCNVPDNLQDLPVPGPKSKKKTERDIVGLDVKGNRVLFMSSEADLVDKDADFLNMKLSLFKKHPNVNIRSNLTDCHLYLMKKWVIDYLADNKLSSIKGELIPHLVKKQHAKKPKAEFPNPNESVISEQVKTDILSYIPEDKMQSMIEEMSTWIDHRGDMADCYHGDRIRCYAYIQTGGLCVRTNTLGSYNEINKQISRHLMSVKKDFSNIHSSESLKNKPQIGADCLVGKGTSIGEKTSVKRSVIGQHCTIGEKVKISNSVILDYVHVADGCSVQGCIVSSNVQIGEKSDIKDCIVGNGQTVSANSKISNEALVAREEMFEI